MEYIRMPWLSGSAGCREFPFSLRIHLQGQILFAIAAHGKLPNGFAVLRSGPGKAEPGVMIANQGVSGGRDVAPDDLGDPSQAGLLDQVLKKRFLDASAEDAAGHDPGIDLPGWAGLTANDG